MANQGNKVALAKLAGLQFGRVGWSQIRGLGVAQSTISKWITQGYLFPRLPGVYAVGSPATSTEASLAEALLYAGPGAMLSHATAAWWLGLFDEQPRQIHVSTTRQCRSIRRIRVHRRRGHERAWHKRLTITTLPQTLLDLSATAPLRTVRRALAEADYRGVLDLQAIDAILGKGRPGSTKLRGALQRHRPELALTKSRLERMFLEICEDQGWELPELNQYTAGWQIDALWRDKAIAVELDGYGNHHSPAQLKRDRRKELDLRKAGLTPVRYCEEQLKERTELIADLTALRKAS